MNKIEVTGIVINCKLDTVSDGISVANMFLYDSKNPNRKRPIFKAAFWGADAEEIKKTEVGNGDELTFYGSCYILDNNSHGSFIDVRQCQLRSIAKNTRKEVYQSECNDVNGRT